MVLLNNIITIIGKLVEATLTLIFTIPLMIITFVIVYITEIILNLFKK